MQHVLAVLAFLHVLSVSAQIKLPSTFPHDYPGKPSGDLSPEWQQYYQVTEPLPNVSFPLPRHFAGNIPVNRPDHPNCTLFFWGFERTNGSLSAAAGASQEPWMVWLNGGPGASSMYGLFFENGPMTIRPNLSVVHSKYGWSDMVDIFFVDQPVGTGWSTSDAEGYVEDEDMMGRDFKGFLGNLAKIFPSLATRPLYIIGESYAGVYIPYIAKELLSDPDPPVSLRNIAIGNGAMGSLDVMQDLPAVSIIETYPQLVGFNPEIYTYFRDQAKYCGYNVTLTYPQRGRIPLPNNFRLASPSIINRISNVEEMDAQRSFLRSTISYLSGIDEQTQRKMKRDSHIFMGRSLENRANDSADPWYGCFHLTMLHDYVMNFTVPWSKGGYLNYYNIPDAISPEVPTDASVFLNDNQTRAAIHAPKSKDWDLIFRYPFNWRQANARRSPFFDPSDPPMVFFDALFANATEKNVQIIFYSGNDDFILAHRGTEVVIQNTTWGGIQGFSRQPTTTWTNDRGVYAGIVHQERNVMYALFKGAGHEVPRYQPENAFVFLREFILGQNRTGLRAQQSQNDVSEEEPEVERFDERIIKEYSAPVFTGVARTQGSTSWPSATVEAWEKFIATAATAQATAGIFTDGQISRAHRVSGTDKTVERCWWIVVILLFARIVYI